MFLFLDLDRTVLDHDWTQGRAVRAFLALHRDALLPEHERLAASPDLFEIRWRDVTEHWMDRHFAGEVGYFEQRVGRMTHFFGPRPEEELLGRYQAYLEAYEAHTRVFEDVTPLLEALPRRPGLITNGRGEIQRGKLLRAGLLEAFDPVIVSGEVRHAKPDPRIFHRAAREAGRSPEACFYVGDKLGTDAVAARKAGWGSAWLRRDGREAEPPDLEVPTVGSLAELPALLGFSRAP